jgi:hypothetical protein
MFSSLPQHHIGNKYFVPLYYYEAAAAMLFTGLESFKLLA